MDIGSMGLWEWVCATEGHALANGSKKAMGTDISDDRLSEMGIEGF